MGLQDLAHDRKPETGAACIAGAAGIDAIETLSESRQMSGRDPGTVVPDLKERIVPITTPGDIDMCHIGV